MCVQPISALSFRAGKIELNDIKKRDLSNYDSIKLLAKQSHCDFLIEKKSNKYTPDYNVYCVLARRKWIQPNYIFAQELTSAHKSETKEAILQKIYEATKKASQGTKVKILELAKTLIEK